MSSMRRISRALDAKYKKADLNKVMTEKCEQFSPSERESLLNIELF